MYFRSIMTGQRYWAETDEAQVPPFMAYVRRGRWWWPVQTMIGPDETLFGRSTWVFRDNLEPERAPVMEVLGSHDPTSTKADEIIEEHKREVMVAEDPLEDLKVPEGGSPAIVTDSEPETPNLQPYLREMSYNVGQAFVALAETVNDKDAATLYLLQAARASLSDEIRRLSDKEERSHG